MLPEASRIAPGPRRDPDWYVEVRSYGTGMTMNAAFLYTVNAGAMPPKFMRLPRQEKRASNTPPTTCLQIISEDFFAGRRSGLLAGLNTGGIPVPFSFAFISRRRSRMV